MSSQDSPTLALDVRARRAEPCLVLLATALAALVPWLITDIATSAILSLSLAVTVVTLTGFRKAGWLGGPGRIGRVVWQADGRWVLAEAGGHQFEAELRTDTRVSQVCLWLRWHIPGTRSTRSMLLACGDAPESDLRGLLTRLRIDGPRIRAGSSDALEDEQRRVNG